MELFDMVCTFKRSETSWNLKYFGYIDDGDANIFFAIAEVETYGTVINISKIKCVDHIYKRMGMS